MRYIISFFMFFLTLSSLSSQDFIDSIWTTTSESEDMTALLAIEFLGGHQCVITHAYLKNEDETPYKQDFTQEEWYVVSEDLIMIQDNWGEFIPLSIVTESGEVILRTRLGSQDITLTRTSQSSWEILIEGFSLSRDQS